jgi:hypothetical protein
VDAAKRLVGRQRNHASEGQSDDEGETQKVVCPHSVPLSLNGLTSISDDLAAILATYDGALSLTGLTHASDQSLRLLRKPQNKLPDAPSLSQSRKPR